METAQEDDIEVPQEMRDLWELLLKKKRVERRPHVTIVHSKSLPEAKPLWDRCQALQKLVTPPLFGFRLSHLVTDGRILALTVEEMEALQDVEDGKEFLQQLPDDVRNHLHITVGTQDPSVGAWTAGGMVESWKAGDPNGAVFAIPLKALKGQGCVKPLS